MGITLPLIMIYVNINELDNKVHTKNVFFILRKSAAEVFFTEHIFQNFQSLSIKIYFKIKNCCCK